MILVIIMPIYLRLLIGMRLSWCGIVQDWPRVCMIGEGGSKRIKSTLDWSVFDYNRRRNVSIKLRKGVDSGNCWCAMKTLVNLFNHKIWISLCFDDKLQNLYRAFYDRVGCSGETLRRPRSLDIRSRSLSDNKWVDKWRWKARWNAKLASSSIIIHLVLDSRFLLTV